MSPLKSGARTLKLDHGEAPLIGGPVDILWGNTDAEYAGAVRFLREGDTTPAETAPRLCAP